MQDNKYYYDEQIKDYFFERNLQSFSKSKEELNSMNISSLLSLQTKMNLTDIAKRLDIKGYSKLGKDALVNLLSDSILGDLDNILKSLSYKELMLLKNISKDDLVSYKFSIDELAPLGGLSAIGLLHKVSIKDSLYLVVPEDIKNSINSLANSKSYIKELLENSKATNYIDGLLTHYGLLLASDLYEIINNPNCPFFKKENMDFYINYIFRCYEAFPEVSSIIHPFVLSPEDVYEEIRVRQTIAYDFNNSDYYIKLGENSKALWNDEIYNLQKILIKNNVKKSECDLIINELLFYIKNDLGSQSLVDFLIDRGLTIKDEENNSDVIHGIADVYNNTGMWTLKGLTPKELSERRTTIVKKDKEPGRNEPCPCGSGKKYKKCCGK